jgi:hypothetical protein
MKAALIHACSVEWSSIKSFALGSFITWWFMCWNSSVKKPKTRMIHEFNKIKNPHRRVIK